MLVNLGAESGKSLFQVVHAGLYGVTELGEGWAVRGFVLQSGDGLMNVLMRGSVVLCACAVG